MLELVQWGIKHKEGQSSQARGCWSAATAFLGARPRSVGTPLVSGCYCSSSCSYLGGCSEISKVLSTAIL